MEYHSFVIESPDDIQDIREMVEDINQLLEDKWADKQHLVMYFFSAIIGYNLNSADDVFEAFKTSLRIMDLKEERGDQV